MTKTLADLSLVILLTIITPFLLFGQDLDKPIHYGWFDEMIGKANSGIFVGTEYVEHYRMLNEKHKFFDSPNFSIASIVYDGQPYFNLELKYDLYEDQMLLRYSDQPNSPTIVLEKHKISSFIINGHQFENIPFDISNNSNPFGFLEVLLVNDSIVLYEKHQKRIRTRTNDKIRFYEFKDDNSYYIFYGGSYYQINEKGSMFSIFPNYKVELKTIENQYKKLRKENPSAYLKSVLESLFNNMVQITPKEQ